MAILVGLPAGRSQGARRIVPALGEAPGILLVPDFQTADALAAGWPNWNDFHSESLMQYRRACDLAMLEPLRPGQNIVRINFLAITCEPNTQPNQAKENDHRDRKYWMRHEAAHRPQPSPHCKLL